MSFNFAVAAGAVAATYVFLVTLLRLTQDSKEPASISDAIPFVTPMVNMAAKGVNFHRLMRDKYKLPIYTLRMPGSRLYIVNSPSLLAPIQNQVRKLSFTAIEATIAANVFGVNKDTNAVIGANLTNDTGYLMNFPKYVHAALSTGPGLDALNARSIEVISQSLDNWAKKGSTTVQMFEWVRHELLLASTEGVYGPENPFRDPAMEQAWYTFEPKMMMFVLNLFPRLFARDSFKAREYMVKVWERYFEERSYEKGSELIKARVKINEDFGISLKETARIEIGGSQAILSNTLPATFWVTFHVFSDPAVLKDIRNELLQGVCEDKDGSCTIDLTYVKSSCPIFLSTFKEVMRLHSTSTATRMAMEDHQLDGKYLLKKGSTILMPSKVQHTNSAVWGTTVDDFNHNRFMREAGVKRVNPVAFRAFGGGTTLCPGRHFATTEILMFTALLVLRFDVVPVDGKWVQPTTANSPMVNAMPFPDVDVNVELRPRDSRDWKVSFSDYDKDMEISVEDIEGIKHGAEH
ncbi:cytochrome P450 [Pestalotiopsis sp. NC0098]|nr:cytochrome P450 [Pestalotiopsis sp. NC0098]